MDTPRRVHHHPAPLFHRRRSRRLSVATTAAMTGLLISAAPALAASPSPTSTVNTSSTSTPVAWSVDVSGGSAATKWHQARQAGGGILLQIWQVPGGDGKADSAKITLTMSGEAIAARKTTTTTDGASVAAAGSTTGFKLTRGDGKTTVTLTSTGHAQWVFLARSGDLKDDEGAWTRFVNWLTGDDSDDSSSRSGDATPQPTSTPTTTPTPTPTPTSMPTASATPSGSPGTGSSESPTADSSPTSGSGRSGEDCDAASQDPTPTPTPTPAPTPTVTPVLEAGRARDTTGQGHAENGTPPEPTQDSFESGGQIADGPNAPATFSAQTLAKAAAASPSASATPTTSTTTSDCAGDGEADLPRPGSPTSASSDDGSGTGSTTRRPNLLVGDWESGATGDATGIGEARGTAPEVATTWQGTDTGLGVLAEGGEYGPSTWGEGKSIILNTSPFDDGGSWAKAANGDYDDTWRETARNAKKNWGSRTGDFYYSVAWELNGNWFNYGVKKEETADYQKAMARYIDIVHEEFPKALFTITFNRESNGYDGDSMDLWVKGADVMGVDYYNHYPYAASTAQFKSAAVQDDGGGGPKGMQAWLDAAEKRNVPLVVPEWGGSAKDGDSPAFFESMYVLYKDNAGPGAGQLAAESLFEIDKDDNNWRLLGDTRMPQSAATYKRLWHWVGGAAEFDTTEQDVADLDPTATAITDPQERIEAAASPQGGDDTD